MNDRPLVIYHDNCLDGFGAAWCFWHKYGNDADYFASTYKQDPPRVTGRHVYLVDFSYKSEVVKRLLLTAASITIIDHHKTAIDDLAPLFHEWTHRKPDLWEPECVFDWHCSTSHSGAVLAWEYLYPGQQRPLLLDYIEDRDLWKFKLPRSRAVNAFLFSQDYRFELWDELIKCGPEELDHMAEFGGVLERKQKKDVATLLSICQRELEIAGYVVPVANVPIMFSSDAGELMAQGKPFAACYTDTANSRDFNLRSSTEDGLDVSEIAKAFGGGGHPKASGFSVPRDHPLAKS